jgi:hypothetical protein
MTEKAILAALRRMDRRLARLVARVAALEKGSAQG